MKFREAIYAMMLQASKRQNITSTCNQCESVGTQKSLNQIDGFLLHDYNN